MLSLKITSADAEDSGVCMMDSSWGTVCLLENSAKDSLDTYRVSTTKWATAIAAYSSDQGDIIDTMKGNTGAKQDTSASNVTSWFDSFYCTEASDTNYVCTGWQPDWMGGLT